MSDKVLRTLQQLVQGVIRSEVREPKARVSSLERDVGVRFNALQREMDTKFDVVEQGIGVESSLTLPAAKLGQFLVFKFCLSKFGRP